MFLLEFQVHIQFWLSCLGPWSDADAKVLRWRSRLSQVQSDLHWLCLTQQGLEVVIGGCRRWSCAGGRAVVIGRTCGGRHRWSAFRSGRWWIRAALSILHKVLQESWKSEQLGLLGLSLYPCRVILRNSETDFFFFKCRTFLIGDAKEEVSPNESASRLIYTGLMSIYSPGWSNSSFFESLHLYQWHKAVILQSLSQSARRVSAVCLQCQVGHVELLKVSAWCTVAWTVPH